MEKQRDRFTAVMVLLDFLVLIAHGVLFVKLWPVSIGEIYTIVAALYFIFFLVFSIIFLKKPQPKAKRRLLIAVNILNACYVLATAGFSAYIIVRFVTHGV